MSVDVSRQIKKSGATPVEQLEADKSVEKILLIIKSLLNRLGTNIGDWATRIVIKATSYNFIPSILVSFIFSYIALSDDVKILVRRKIPVFIREAILDLCSLGTLTFWIASVGFALGAWLFCSNSISDIILKRQNRKLKAENSNLQEKNFGMSIDCYEVFSKFLYSTFRKYSYGNTERISLYILDLDHFRCIGRYSDDEKYRERPTKMYLKEAGFIGKAWKSGEFSIAQLPDPTNDLDGWVNSNIIDTNITRATVECIGMRSRSFHCTRIKNSKSTSIAIIVFESTCGTLPNEKTIKDDFGKNEARTIANLVDALKPHMVNLEFAKRQGF